MWLYTVIKKKLENPDLYDLLNQTLATLPINIISVFGKTRKSYFHYRKAPGI